MNFCERRPEISYPCEWGYRVIGESEEDIRDAIFEIINKEHRFSRSNKSRTGKYVSFNIELEVESEAERDAIFRAFKVHKAIKMVI